MNKNTLAMFINNICDIWITGNKLIFNHKDLDATEVIQKVYQNYKDDHSSMSNNTQEENDGSSQDKKVLANRKNENTY